MGDLTLIAKQSLEDFIAHCDDDGRIPMGGDTKINLTYELVRKGYVSGIPLIEKLNDYDPQPRLLEKGLVYRDAMK